MTDDRQASGIIGINPPLNWAEIRSFHADLEKALGKNFYTVMALSQTKKTEDTEEGTVTRITSDMAEVYEEGARNTETFLLLLAKKFGKTHDLTGEVLIVEPQCEQEFSLYDNRDASRFTFKDGKLMRQYPVLSWGPAEEYK